MPVPRLFLWLVVVSALVLLPGLLIGPSLDAAVFAQVADRLGGGTALYAGAWDHKPPGIYAVLVGAQLMLPFLGAWPVAWTVTVFATAGAGTALAVCLRGMGVGPPATLITSIAAVVAMAQYLLSLGGGLTESVAVLPLSAAMMLAFVPRRPDWKPPALVGLLLAIALLFSLQAAAGAAMVAVVLVARATRGSRIRVVASMLLAGLLPVAAALAWLAATSSLAAAIDAVIGYSAAYRAVQSPAADRFLSPLAAWTLLALLFLIVPAVLGAARMLRAPGTPRTIGLACLAWIGLGTLLFVYQGHFYGHYAIPLVLPLAVLAAPGIERAISAPRTPRKRPLLVGLRLAPLVIGAVVSVLAGLASARMEADAVAAVNARASAVAMAVRPSADPADRLWVWGNAPQVYLSADLPQATAYSYLYPLVTPGYTTSAMIDAVLADLVGDPPDVVVDAGSPSPGSPGFPPLLIPRPVASDGRDLDILDPLRAFIADHYDRGTVVDGWIVYRLNAKDPAMAGHHVIA